MVYKIMNMDEITKGVNIDWAPWHSNIKMLGEEKDPVKDGEKVEAGFFRNYTSRRQNLLVYSHRYFTHPLP